MASVCGLKRGSLNVREDISRQLIRWDGEAALEIEVSM